MSRLARYMTKTFIVSWLTLTFGFLVLIGLLDSIANGGDIIASGEGFIGTFKYIGLRAPVIFDRILVFTIVVAILLTFVKLIRNHELVALLGFGLSVPSQIKALVPAVLLVSVASVTAINFIMPPNVQSLQAWGIGEYKRSNISEDKPLVLIDDNMLIHVTGRTAMNRLNDLEFNQLAVDGKVERVTWADAARYSGDRGWVLEGVTTLNVSDDLQNKPDMALWETRQTPESIARMAAEPRDLSLTDLAQFKTTGNSGAKPSFAYEFWFWHRITRPIAALVLLLCCVPLMQRTGRQDTGDVALIIGITMGFVYLIIDGALATFAVQGGLPTGWAIVSPMAIFAFLGLWLCLRTESLS